MISLYVNSANGQAVLQFPREARLPNKFSQIKHTDMALLKWEQETRTYILSTLKRWVLQRNAAFKAKKELTGKRAVAVDKLLFMMSMHKESRLHVVCNRIERDGDYLTCLAPQKNSKQFQFFKEVIAPILLWVCEFNEIN
ncbi:hypothetical protein ACR777_20105 [Sphingobacterium spiritivorum]|uniref:hypothetical protein n=1 Tax=Sphingobacterium spiritivorum TaxID=258 RepID=UPI003DA1EE8E